VAREVRFELRDSLRQANLGLQPWSICQHNRHGGDVSKGYKNDAHKAENSVGEPSLEGFREKIEAGLRANLMWKRKATLGSLLHLAVQ
jgi:hypothetical protein